MSSFSLVYANFAGLAVYNESIGITELTAEAVS